VNAELRRFLSRITVALFEGKTDPIVAGNEMSIEGEPRRNFNWPRGKDARCDRPVLRPRDTNDCNRRVLRPRYRSDYRIEKIGQRLLLLKPNFRALKEALLRIFEDRHESLAVFLDRKRK